MIVYKTDIYSIDKNIGEFLGGPVIRTWCFHCGDLGSIPGQGTKTQQVTQGSQKKKRERENVRNECFHTMWQLYNL